MIPRNNAKSDSRTICPSGEKAVLFVGSEKWETRAYGGWKRALGSSEGFQMRKIYSAEGSCKVS